MSAWGQSPPMRTPPVSRQVRNSLKADQGTAMVKRFTRSRTLRANPVRPNAVSPTNTDRAKRLPAQCGLLLWKTLASASLGDAFYSNPSTVQRSRTAPSPSVFNASPYAGLSYAAVALSKLGCSTTTVRSLSPCSRATAASPRAPGHELQKA